MRTRSPAFNIMLVVAGRQTVEPARKTSTVGVKSTMDMPEGTGWAARSSEVCVFQNTQNNAIGIEHRQLKCLFPMAASRPLLGTVGTRNSGTWQANISACIGRRSEATDFTNDQLPITNYQ